MQELAQLPENDVTAEYVDAMAAAVQEYGKADAVVLFVIQPGEKNSYDQQVNHAALDLPHYLLPHIRTRPLLPLVPVPLSLPGLLACFCSDALLI